MLTVARADPRLPEVRALLEQSHALMRESFPPEDNYFLDIDALCGPDIRFFAACDGKRVLGTGALALRDGYGEIKSMFTAETARGQGIGAAILHTLETEACTLGLPCLRLETAEALAAAVRLYERAGFVRCGIFGDYKPNATSLYMEKLLS